MMSIFNSLYHHMPDKVKRVIRLYSYSYNDVAGGGKTLFRDRIQRVMKEFLPNGDKNWKRIEKDIKKCWLKYGSSPEEYFLFDFKNLNEKGRSLFITDYVKDMKLKKRIGLDKFQKDLLDKYNFYCLTKPFFNRNAMSFNQGTSKRDFVEFAKETKNLFIKPISKSRGRGAHKITIDNEDDALNEYNYLVGSDVEWIVEETIVQSMEMEKWNPTSVNTIRVPSFLNRSGFSIVGPVLRSGRRGAIVDNAAAGGIVASVDVNSGVIISDGVDERGNTFAKHPDSNIPFKGTVIQD